MLLLPPPPPPPVDAACAPRYATRLGSEPYDFSVPFVPYPKGNRFINKRPNEREREREMRKKTTRFLHFTRRYLPPHTEIYGSAMMANLKVILTTARHYLVLLFFLVALEQNVFD